MDWRQSPRAGAHRQVGVAHDQQVRSGLTLLAWVARQ
jgi:hypothetical protein